MPSTSSAAPTNGHRPPGETSEARIAKALAHPLRARILQRLGERVASPGELAVELGASLGVVSYHVRMLRDYDCVELVRTEPRRRLPAGLRRELSGETIQALVDDLGQAADGGTLDDPEPVLSCTPLELDQRGFDKLNRLLARTHEQALAIARESSG